jgi:hypothetical protein
MQRLREADPQRYRQWVERNAADAAGWTPAEKRQEHKLHELEQRDAGRAAAYQAHQREAARLIEADAKIQTWERRQLEAAERQRADAVLGPRALHHQPRSAAVASQPDTLHAETVHADQRHAMVKHHEQMTRRWQQHVEHQKQALQSIAESSQADALDRADVRHSLQSVEDATLGRSRQAWLDSLEPGRRRQMASRDASDQRLLEQSGLQATQSRNQAADALTFGAYSSCKTGDALEVLSAAATLGGNSLSRQAGQHLGRSQALAQQARQLDELGVPDAAAVQRMSSEHAVAGATAAGTLAIGTLGGLNPYTALARGRLRGKLLDDAVEATTTVGTAATGP